MRTRIRAGSKEYVGAPIRELSGINPTTDTVQLCLTTGDTAPSTWTTGIWKTIRGQYWALVLIGPGSTIGQLAAGRYWINVKVTDNPEIPVLTSPNQITIY